MIYLHPEKLTTQKSLSIVSLTKGSLLGILGGRIFQWLAVVLCIPPDWVWSDNKWGPHVFCGGCSRREPFVLVHHHKLCIMDCATHVFCILYFSALAAMYRNHNSLVLSIAGFSFLFIVTMEIQHMLSAFIHSTRFKCLAKRSCGFWITEEDDYEITKTTSKCQMFVSCW